MSLESYIVGQLFVAIMQAIDGPLTLTRENFLKAARRQPYEVGGIKIDFMTDNQGSDFVGLMLFNNGRFVPATTKEVAALFKSQMQTRGLQPSASDVSQVSTPAFTKVAQCFLCKRVKTTRCNICLKLSVPGFSIKRLKPISEGGEFFTRKLGYSDFNFRNYID